MDKKYKVPSYTRVLNLPLYISLFLVKYDTVNTKKYYIYKRVPTVLLDHLISLWIQGRLELLVLNYQYTAEGEKNSR